MAQEIPFQKALELSTILSEMGCTEALAAPTRMVDGLEDPPPNIGSSVFCNQKARATLRDTSCAIMNKSNCPLDLSLDDIKLE